MDDQFERNRFFVDLESLIVVTTLFVHVDNRTMFYYSDNEF